MDNNQRRKILFIVQLPPPVHGASIMNSNVFNSDIIKRSFDIEVVNLQFSKLISEISRFSFKKIPKAFHFGFEIIKKILIQKPDLVYFTISPTGYAFYRDIFYVFLIKLFNKKIVFHLHGKGIKKKIKNAVRKYLYLCVFKNAYVICLSKRLVNDIEEVCKSVPYIVPNGIQLQPDAGGKKIHKNGSALQILYLSTYARNKGVLVFVDALKEIKRQGYNFEARLVGAPSDLTIEFLNKLINDQDLSDCVKIIGPRYGDDKKNELKNADIFVHPTFNDCFPLVLLEAMQNSLPVVSTIEGAISDIVVEGETGFLVEPHNTKGLTEKIKILLEKKELREEMGKKGYERFINNYTLNHFENDMVRTFQNILATK
jgi:glycosyltransferase involved in cell wall biosynthesis